MKREDTRRKFLLEILKAKGDCISVACREECPLYPGCKFDMFDDDTHYERAERMYVEVYGRDRMVEDLL